MATVDRKVEIMDDLGNVHIVSAALADLLDEYGMDDDEVAELERRHLAGDAARTEEGG